MQRLPQRRLTESEKALLYDTLQYIAVSKRDFHENHYLLTKSLLTYFVIPTEPRHPLPHDYLVRLCSASPCVADMCRLVILLGFVLDGKMSFRERSKLRRLNHEGILHESARDLRRYARDFLDGTGIDGWSGDYLSRIECAA
jgi:hypothetical protein